MSCLHPLIIHNMCGYRGIARIAAQEVASSTPDLAAELTEMTKLQLVHG